MAFRIDMDTGAVKDYGSHTRRGFSRLRLRGLILIVLVALAGGALAHGPGAAGSVDLDPAAYLPLVVSAGPPAGPEAVANGDFEDGRTAWTEYEDSVFFEFPQIVHADEMPDPIAPYEGDWAAWLGGDSLLGSYIEQTITVPAMGPQLTYWHWVDAGPYACDESRGGVTVDGALVDGYALCTATDTGGWVRRTVDLAPYAGETVRLRFASQTSATNYGSLYIDAVSVRGTP
jgi:hypothetical protein